jgi:predicted 3-demethylubiquinone-9 3-methyltransferase (glyoxalase superfamily)
MHECPHHGSWAICILLSCRGGERVSDALKWDLSAKGENPERKASILQDCWGVAVELTSQPRNMIYRQTQGMPDAMMMMKMH